LIFYRFSEVEDNLMAKKDGESRRLMKKDLEDLKLEFSKKILEYVETH